MANEILPYLEMCQREASSLQRGMNFDLGDGYSLDAAVAYKNGEIPAPLVRVYEKIHQGIWSYNGIFQLVDGWKEHDRKRPVFKFKLVPVSDDNVITRPYAQAPRRRLIPTSVKIEVWDRDRGKCVICGATDELHFDHDLPFSLGGSSLTAANVQLLCARHNLSKGAKII